MLTLLSPAKTLDFESVDKWIDNTSIPRFALDANRLIRILKKLKVNDVKNLMHISDDLAKLNTKRYKTYSKEYTAENSKSAILAFRGDVYVGLEADTMSKEDTLFANEHVRILSGLYGILNPLDRMQPYRLEMGTRLGNKQGSNLYQYWGDKLSKALNKDLADINSSTIVNLASNEYFKAVNKKKLKADIINVDFREEKDGEMKFVSFFAKKARGLMARYIIDNRLSNPEDLRGFDYEGYRFVEELSSEKELLFAR